MDAIRCEAVLTAAELGSMTAVASQLGYTQSGVTRMISALEQELGFPLFIRGKKGVTLTENGRMMLPVIREIVRAEHDAEQLGADILGSVRGILTIGSYYSISAMWLPDVLKEFQQRYPGVRVRLREGGNREMGRWLSERSVDCCFSAEQEKGMCDWIPLFKDEMTVWLPENHPLAEQRTFPVRRLEQEPFIHTQPGEDTELDRLLASLELHPDVCFSTRDAFTTYNMVAAGLGISFNQRLISKKWRGAVKELPFDPPQYVSLGIAVPALSEVSPAAGRFIALAKARAAGETV